MKNIFTKLLMLSSLFAANVYSYELINPGTFTGTEESKQAVLLQIKNSVEKTYSAIGMGEATTLRMMEKEELKAFKSLTSAKDKNLLDKTIEKYCAINMCSYTVIRMMYEEEEIAGKQELEW
jgi:hypothetical protein